FKVRHQALRAAHRATDVATGFDVPTPDRRAAELRVIGKDLFDLDPWHVSVTDEVVEVTVGNVTAVLLDATDARQDERRLEARRKAAPHDVEFGNEVFHRSLICHIPRRSCSRNRTSE